MNNATRTHTDVHLSLREERIQELTDLIAAQMPARAIHFTCSDCRAKANSANGLFRSARRVFGWLNAARRIVFFPEQIPVKAP